MSTSGRRPYVSFTTYQRGEVTERESSRLRTTRVDEFIKTTASERHLASETVPGSLQALRPSSRRPHARPADVINCVIWASSCAGQSLMLCASDLGRLWPTDPLHTITFTWPWQVTFKDSDLTSSDLHLTLRWRLMSVWQSNVGSDDVTDVNMAEVIISWWRHLSATRVWSTLIGRRLTTYINISQSRSHIYSYTETNSLRKLKLNNWTSL